VTIVTGANNENRSAVLVDRYPLVLEGMHGAMERAGVEVVGQTTSPGQALELVTEQAPGLLVTDVELGEGNMNGISCVREARTRVRDIKAIVLSERDDPEQVSEALEAGADAYVVLTAQVDDLASVVRQVFDPSVFLSGAVAAEPVRKPDPSAGELTRREQEILTLVAEGRSNAGVARLLWVTEQTVKFHLSNVYRKLGVSNRTEASRWAQLQGLLERLPDGPESSALRHMRLVRGGGA
jgi:DNA-binding NarL/FixJ family response regulator